MVDGILRRSAFPVGHTAQEQRQLLRAALSAHPLPADLTVTAGTLGGVPTHDPLPQCVVGPDQIR